MRIKSLLLSLSLLPGSLLADLHYNAKPDVERGTVDVSLNLDAPQDAIVFKLPAWDPGYYLILHNESRIGNFQASDPSGNPLEVRHNELRSWTVINPAKTHLTIRYTVLGDDPALGFFAVHMDDQTGYINGPAAFMYIDGRKEERDTLSVQLPKEWDIATAMHEQPDGSYDAPNYDEFVDHPIQMGHFTRTTFDVEGIPFEAVFVCPGGMQCDPKVESAHLQAVSAPAIKMFHGAPFKHYLYILHLAIGNFAGGLEHRACNVQAIANTPDLNIDQLAAHEYFHAWNVKQIRPKVLGPFDYSQEVLTANLWFAEGVTDYYSYMTAYRSGLHGEDWLLMNLGDQIDDLQHSKVRQRVTLADCSRRAWENGGMGVGDLSYYNKGLVAGLLLDSWIRSKTHGQKSLDDVMRLMYAKYKLPQPGYEEDGILQAINQVSGHDCKDLYSRIVDTTEEMPYSLLAGLGLQFSGHSLTPTRNRSEEAGARYSEWLRRS